MLLSFSNIFEISEQCPKQILITLWSSIGEADNRILIKKIIAACASPWIINVDCCFIWDRTFPLKPIWSTGPRTLTNWEITPTSLLASFEIWALEDWSATRCKKRKWRKLETRTKYITWDMLTSTPVQWKTISSLKQSRNPGTICKRWNGLNLSEISQKKLLNMLQRTWRGISG